MEPSRLKVIIVTEGGKIGGLGHIQRCLAISQAFEEKRIKSTFIVNGDTSIKRALKGKNYQIYNWLKRKKVFFELVKKFDIAIIDSYLGDINFYQKLSELVKVPVYLDDNRRLDYPRGVVVNGGIHAKNIRYPKKKNIRYLLGNRYAPLRKLFWEAGVRKIKQKIKSVMVTTGGNDPQNVMPKIAQFLKVHYPALKKNIIIGNAFQNIDQIKKEVDLKTGLIYFPDAKKMKEVMVHSDIAISSGGQTLFELARVGVPTIAFRQAENQKLNLETWDKEGFIEYAGDYTHLEKKLSQSLDRLSLKKDRGKRMRAGMKLVDGQGARRIREALLIYEN